MYATAFERTEIEPFGTPERLWGLVDGPPDHDDRVGYVGGGFARLAAQHGRRGVDVLALAEALLAKIDDSQVAWLPGARRALEAAADRQVALVTNGPAERQRPKLDALSGRDYFDCVVYAADLSRRKPHTAPFERALGALGVGPEEALYVGNSLGYDVAGAHTADIDVAWVGEGDPAPYEPEFVLASVGELVEVLAE